MVALAVFLISQRRVRNPILDLRIFSNRNLSSASGVNLLVGFCIMVALVSVPLFINVAGAADTMKAALVTGYLLCAFTVPMALAAVPGGWLSRTARLSIVGHPRLDRRHHRLLDDESLEGRNGQPSGRLLRPSARPRSARRSWHRVHGCGAGAGRNRNRVDHRANRDCCHQRCARTGSWDGVVARHHPSPDRHERQHELDDGVWAAADDGPQPRDAQSRRCTGFGEDGQSRARRRDEDHERDGADCSGRGRDGRGRRPSASAGRRFTRLLRAPKC